jgi:hypothetical protein
MVRIKIIKNNIVMKKIALSAALLLLSLTGFSKIQKMSVKNLCFEIDQDGSNAAFVLEGKASEASRGADFWRLILDDGHRTEIPILSHSQKGKVSLKNGVMTVEYNELISEYGDKYPILFRVTIEKVGELLRFTPHMENNTKDIRINECVCPMADFTTLYGEKSKDALYWPEGPGVRHQDPWRWLKNQSGLYYNHDEYEVTVNLIYPRASMSWYGIQSADKFLYISRQDPEMRLCFLSLRHRINEDNISCNIVHWPMARPGEKITEPSSVVGVLDGDWREGAKTYRKWADANFFKMPKIDKWMRHMTGFQRVIMRSQYGEDHFKPEDLPALYESGAKHGIKTLFLFGWWKEGMDRAYPKYEEAYPGAFKELADNIRKVQELGGRVILECNCHFMDPAGDFYKEYGEECRLLDINGNEYRPAFVYSGRGELRQRFGKVQFPLVCEGSPRWRDVLAKQVRQIASLGADCVFMDCYGFCPYQPCFNDTHEHGNRIDEAWIYKHKIFKDAMDYCYSQNRVLGTEGVTDIAAVYCQLLHGNIQADYKVKSNQFPQLFRYTFPEAITTERVLLSSFGNYERQVKSALVMGERFDSQLWVCKSGMEGDPEYAKHMGWCAKKLEEYADYFFDGRFTVLDTSELPYYVKRSEWYSADGKKILRVLYNVLRRNPCFIVLVVSPILTTNITYLAFIS